MIPKIAHFHWVGKPMNWLRWASIRTFEKFHPDYEIRIIRTPPDIASKVSVYAHQADWAWYRQLHEHGGWQIATDVVFTGRIPDEWGESQHCVCTNGTRRIYQFAVMGAEKGSKFFDDCDKRCAVLADRGRLSYQTLGVDMLADFCIPPGNFDQPMNAFCPVKWNAIDPLWGKDYIELPEETVGVHWYGGYPLSKKNEWLEPSNDWYIVRLARSILGGD